MRDPGLSKAIAVAGGVGALARALGISQPSVSGWSRIPAERVAAVEAATGISRTELRPDLFATLSARPRTFMRDDALGAMTDQTMAVDPIDAARAEHYLLLAALTTRPPTAELLSQLAQLKGDASPLGMAILRVADAAARTTEIKAGEEFFNLFVGVGRGELVPFGSYYLTGFLYDRPLARLREDLAKLGIVRAEGVNEPEDSIGAVCEVMAGLIRGDFGSDAAEAGTALDAEFFTRHVKPWASRFFADLQLAEAADFYRAVGMLGTTWLEIETAAYELPE